MFGRPKFGETDEDILRLEEEYFKQRAENKIEPSTKYVGISGSEKTGSTGSSSILHSENSDKTNQNKDVLSERVVVGKIIERNHAYDKIYDGNVTFAAGFPQVKRRQVSTHNKSGSIFSQQRKKLCSSTTPQVMEIDSQPTTSISEFTSTKTIQDRIKNLPLKSYIIEGQEKEEIHKENLNKLSEMTETEIIEEQNKLIDSLDPEIVKFFKSKRKYTDMDTIQERNEEKDFKEEVVEPDQIKTTKDIIQHADKWLHFDKIETEKIQWMKDIVVPQKPGNKNYEARFDFEGWILPYVEPEITEKSRVLYHHGNEPGRPGYSLQELFKLCRSTVQQQRILSLNTISNILALNSTGVYENIVEIPIEQIFFIIRIAMDDNTPAVLNAGVKALHSIFWNQIDEICLDSLFGFSCDLVQPMLTVDNDEKKEDEEEINDQQMAEIDLIKCLMRTDILIRIRYIINTVMPPLETITYCLELLIRLARDSDNIFKLVYQCEDLFSSIVKHFLPKIYQLNISTTAYNVPSTTALKLFRVVASRSKDVAQEMDSQYNILDSVVSYLSNDIATNIVGIKLQIESLNLLAIYINYHLSVNRFREVEPFLIRNLEYHLNNTNISESGSYSKQSHCAAVLNVITQAANISLTLIQSFLPILRLYIVKYCRQVSTLQSFKCGHLQIVSSLLICLQNKIEPNVVDPVLKNFLNSPGFTKITENIQFGSNLLCEYESLKSSANLRLCEAVVWNTSEHVVPILLTTSCIPFLRAISYFILTSCSPEVKLQFLQHKNITTYLTLLQKASKFYLTTNWFTKIEAQFIMNLLKTVVKVHEKLHDLLYYEVAVKSLGIFGAELRNDVDYVLKNVVFNKKFYPSEMLLQELKINESKDVVSDSLLYIEDIYNCYSNVVGLRKVADTNSLILDVRIGNIVPFDWIYSPIVLLYSAKDDAVDEKNKEIIITRCLQWIFLYETYFPVLSSFINTTDKYCRLCCVFLLSNSLFLEENVENLLKCLLKILLSPESYNLFDFDKEIQGLNNFQDFYTEFLEHYQGVSYGNEVFANYVLIPLAQRHNVKWRKTLWSEYMGVAQTITLTREKVILHVKEFLEPPETDISVINCYKNALTNGMLNRSPLLKEIAMLHVQQFIKSKRNK